MSRRTSSFWRPLLFMLVAGLPFGVAPHAALGSDWSRFRGENGSGISPDSASTPTEWSDTKNLKWSVDLPGQGVSCPIVVGERVYVTCWSGAGPDDLVRHLGCYDRQTGGVLWQKDIPPTARDESHDGMFTQTGYAAHTPVCDGKHIYCFFGVSGVFKFDLDGNQVWQHSVGENFDERHWGTASSPVLCDDLVIVTAASESNAIIALKKDNGEEVWRYESPQLDGVWSTPVLVSLPDGRKEAVFFVSGAVWAFDPASGKQNWTCKSAESNSACSSAIVQGDVVYAIGGRNGGGLAIRCGGEGDVTGTHVLWSGNHRARIGTPVCVDGLLYWMADGVANCLDAETGDKVYQERMQAPQTAQADAAVQQAQATEPADAPPAEGRPQESGFGPPRRGGGFGRGGRGGRGGGFMQQDYSSPIVADGKIYFMRRGGDGYVIALGRKYEQLGVNKFSGEADYSASPAAADGQIFIRSSKKLYCVADSGDR